MDAIAAPDAGPARAVRGGQRRIGQVDDAARAAPPARRAVHAHASLLADATRRARGCRASHVLLVDDLHLLSHDQVERVRARSEDPDASLVVASRPWPRVGRADRRSPAASSGAGPRSCSGHVSRSDVLTYLERRRPGHLELVRRSHPRSSPAACRGSSPRRSLCTTSATAPTTSVTAPSCGPSRSASPTASTPSPPPLRHEIEAALRDAPAAHARPLTERRRRHRRRAMPKGCSCATASRFRSCGQPSAPPSRSDRLIDLSAEHGRRARPLRGGRRRRATATGSAASTIRAVGRRLVRARRSGARAATRAGPWSSTAAPSNAAWIRAAIAGRRAQAAWASGRSPTRRARSSTSVPRACDDLTDADRIADTSAAIWSIARHDAHERRGLPLAASRRARLARPRRRSPPSASVSGDSATAERTPAHGLPSTLGVAMELLDRGLRATLTPDGAEVGARRPRPRIRDVHVVARPPRRSPSFRPSSPRSSR